MAPEIGNLFRDYSLVWHALRGVSFTVRSAYWCDSALLTWRYLKNSEVSEDLQVSGRGTRRLQCECG